MDTSGSHVFPGTNRNVVGKMIRVTGVYYLNRHWAASQAVKDDELENTTCNALNVFLLNGFYYGCYLTLLIIKRWKLFQLRHNV